MEMMLSMEWDEPEAKGKITVEEGAYGAWIYVDGKPVAMIDLFHLADADDDEYGKYPQVVIYNGHEWDDPICHAMILEDKTIVRFENYPHEIDPYRHGRHTIVTINKEVGDEPEGSNS